MFSAVLWGSKAQCRMFPAFVSWSLVFLFYTETLILDYTKINFIYDNACPALQTPREGLLSLHFLVVNDSPKVMRLVVLGAWGNCCFYSFLADGSWVMNVEGVTIHNPRSSKENFWSPESGNGPVQHLWDNFVLSIGNSCSQETTEWWKLLLYSAFLWLFWASQKIFLKKGKLYLSTGKLSVSFF